MKKTYSMDMIHGPLFSKLLIYALPLVLSGVLQLLFNAADIVIVGRFSGNHALAAVGSTGALINLLVNLFIGVSIGANVLVARYCGARDEENAQDTVHTAMAVSLIGGVVMIFVGFFLAKPLLELMGTPVDVIEDAALYMRIYFAGMPAFMVYNFGSAILRAIGDTRRPLYFLSVAGIINVVFNLIFVIVFHMGVAGVALATIISQGISAVLVVLCLLKTEGMCQIHKDKLKIHGDKLKMMLQIGLPAGLQGCVFSISNVLIQSSINSFGSIAMAGNTAASNIEGFVYTGMNAIYQTCLSFTSQNLGAKQVKRIKKILMYCLMIVSVIGLVLGQGAYYLGEYLLGIYSSDPEVIQYGLIRLSLVCAPYFLCGMMDVMTGVMRGLGYSVMPMLVSLTGACAFRVIWIYTIFQMSHTLKTLYVSYPISWTLTFSVHFICFLFAYHKLKKVNLESL
ncbi:MAG: MATE family efflux transporter [Erysipelotrichaceae bacterium]|nr:MATE family efflux transporter [Erysipelotrichaceae bacterium]